MTNIRIFTLGLTNIDLEFKVKGWILGIKFQILKNKNKKIQNKNGYFGLFLSWVVFCDKNLKMAIRENCPNK